MTTRICVVGSVNMDLTLGVPALPRPGQTVLASAVNYSPGGEGGNQAVAAARAGGQVQFIGAVGDDAAGDRLRAHLLTNGVGIDGIVVVTGPSGTAIIVVDAGAENTIVVARGANGPARLVRSRHCRQVRGSAHRMPTRSRRRSSAKARGVHRVRSPDRRPPRVHPTTG
ncbi:hypothetical protein F0Q45_06425 [Mycobacterium simiae]|uniref:Carbohydrate kinase PfkB domain-containing protein n=1 Tax=Mycobacterium simiae TaxID=1784 RepID=A0A5B1BQR3_MYCSI|nr:hypothetical protein F0Q45_06425 [Mycobacterium simiae]